MYKAAWSTIYSGSRLTVQNWLPYLHALWPRQITSVLQFSHLQNKCKTKIDLIYCRVCRIVPDTYCHFKNREHSCLAKVKMSMAAVIAVVPWTHIISTWQELIHDPNGIQRASTHMIFLEHIKLFSFLFSLI